MSAVKVPITAERMAQMHASLDALGIKTKAELELHIKAAEEKLARLVAKRQKLALIHGALKDVREEGAADEDDDSDDDN